jgi:hypothetical protein
VNDTESQYTFAQKDHAGSAD